WSFSRVVLLALTEVTVELEAGAVAPGAAPVGFDDEAVLLPAAATTVIGFAGAPLAEGHRLAVPGPVAFARCVGTEEPGLGEGGWNEGGEDAVGAIVVDAGQVPTELLTLHAGIGPRGDFEEVLVAGAVAGFEIGVAFAARTVEGNLRIGGRAGIGTLEIRFLSRIGAALGGAHHATDLRRTRPGQKGREQGAVGQNRHLSHRAVRGVCQSRNP